MKTSYAHRFGAALLVATVAACGPFLPGRAVTVETAPGDIAAVTPANANALPVGAVFDARLNQTLGTGVSRVGDRFSATVERSLVAANGEVVIPAGAMVHGRVTGLQTSARAGDVAAIRLDFDSLTFANRRYPLDAAIVSTEVRRTGPAVGRAATEGAIAGAVLGAILGPLDIQRILAGAAIGAAAGTVISLGTGEVDARMEQGSLLRLQNTTRIQLR